MNYQKGIIGLLLLIISSLVTGQRSSDALPSGVTLSQCISYALANQSLIKQSLLDEEITKRDIRVALSGWYPQVEIDANIERYLKVPIAYYPNLLDLSAPPIPFSASASDASGGVFSANQTLYSSTLFFAARTSRELRKQASENTENSKISIYVDVTKAFFDVLLTEEQIKVLNEDVLRLQRNYKDSYNLYQNGLTDNIDYQRTGISLSNAEAQKKNHPGNIKG